jgi:hypothetical protein
LGRIVRERLQSAGLPAERAPGSEPLFALFATNPNGITSYWSGKGWEPLQNRDGTIPNVPLAKMTSSAACAVRDTTKAHQINRGHAKCQRPIHCVIPEHRAR